MYIPKNLFLKIYKYVPVIAVDAFIIKDKKVLLGKRKIEPYENCWCLPGGRMEINETCEEAVIREVKEETGLECEIVKLLNVYSKKGRDPRGHTVSVGYVLTPIKGKLKPNFESSELKFFPISEIPQNLGFDHQSIIDDALKFLTLPQFPQPLSEPVLP